MSCLGDVRASCGATGDQVLWSPRLFALGPTIIQPRRPGLGTLGYPSQQLPNVNVRVGGEGCTKPDI